MQATEPGTIIRAMIGGEADMDLGLMRRSVAHFCGEIGDDHSLAQLCDDLIQAIELLDLAILHGLPPSMVQRLRLDAQRRLDRLESVQAS